MKNVAIFVLVVLALMGFGLAVLYGGWHFFLWIIEEISGAVHRGAQ